VQDPGSAAFTASAICCIEGRTRPPVLADNHDCEFAPFQILLKWKVRIRREKHVITGVLGSL
jgi:hypothetical protein